MKDCTHCILKTHTTFIAGGFKPKALDGSPPQATLTIDTSSLRPSYIRQPVVRPTPQRRDARKDMSLSSTIAL